MRLGTATAMAVVGIEGRPVRIEAVLLRGLPAVTIVGLPDAASPNPGRGCERPSPRRAWPSRPAG